MAPWMGERSPGTPDAGLFKSEYLSRRPNRTRNVVADEQDDPVDFLSVSPRNLIRLGEDLLRASSIPTTLTNSPTTPEDRQYLSSVSDLISGDRTFTTNPSPVEGAALWSPEETAAGLSPAEVTTLAETFRGVRLPPWVLPQYLTRLISRPYPPYPPGRGTFPGWTYHSDFTPMPSSVNPKSFLA